MLPAASWAHQVSPLDFLSFTFFICLLVLGIPRSPGKLMNCGGLHSHPPLLTPIFPPLFPLSLTETQRKSSFCQQLSDTFSLAKGLSNFQMGKRNVMFSLLKYHFFLLQRENSTLYCPQIMQHLIIWHLFSTFEPSLARACTHKQRTQNSHKVINSAILHSGSSSICHSPTFPFLLFSTPAPLSCPGPFYGPVNAAGSSFQCLLCLCPCDFYPHFWLSNTFQVLLQ